ncbi:MBL fold metallo-hydrolase [Kribbella sp. CA-293567]|uniref:MBL fold metallo-hydrolase n=1 Tax=Kribbella sp. CA-293567 TaxID=3002436 RepID=UPI0022DE5AA3|nr:MBL fold metallo-hydrolase [Kribbella sp. CA-293567]WBQ04367.1 MBL fold metallo-hydrolase [Kribbella sp. CA-293567]
MKAAQRSQQAVGEATVTYLPDGYGRLDAAAIFTGSSGGWSRYQELLDDDGRFEVSIGSFLIRTPTNNILVDLGLGSVQFDVPGLASFESGQLLNSLAGEGLAPADIDTVFYTHLHHDHVGWTTELAPAPSVASDATAAGMTFRNARHLVAAAEWKYWSGTDEVVGPNPIAVQRPLEGIIEFVAENDEIAPGVHVVGTAGHTPGHSSLVVTDAAGNDPTQILVLGDVMHCQIQVGEANWNPIFDVDPNQSEATRRRVIAEFAGADTVIAGGHFSGSVFGQIRPASRWQSL